MLDDPLYKHDNTQKKKATLKVTILSMILNLLVAAGKIVCGVLFGAISLLADGFNNLSDCGSNIVNWIGIFMSYKPADKEHPYGHARGEYVVTLIASFFIIFLAFELFLKSIDTIIEGNKTEFSIISIAVLCVSIVVKLIMYFTNRMVGKRYSSELLIAASVDSIGDVFASLAVLVSLIVGKFTPFDPDGYIGALVAILIGVSGIKILKRTTSELIGEGLPDEIVDEIKKRLLSYEGIYGIHGLTVHNYVNKYFASVHAEIDADIPVLAAHELIDKIEKDFEKNTEIILTIHLDPVILHDAETTIAFDAVTEIVKKIDPKLSLHDFRLVKCERQSKLIFEVGVPYQITDSDNDLLNKIYEHLYDEYGLKYSYSVEIKRE